jgi:type VI secretion system secreted protein Hcp
MSQAEANEIVRETQRLRRTRRALKLGLPTAAALGAGAAIAVASIPGSDGTITGCYASPKGALLHQANEPIAPNGVVEAPGALRVIDPSLPTTIVNPGGSPSPNLAAVCDPKEETKITWNQSGPAGPQGPAGLPAVQSPAAPQGPAGPPGAAGAPLIGDTSFGISGNGQTFLKIDGINGGSNDKTHKGQISVDSFSLDTHSSGGGGGAGKTTIQSFTITKPIDAASPLLFVGSASGKHYKEMVLSFERKAGRGQQDYLKFTFGNVLISGVADGTSAKLVPEEQVTFSFQKCTETFIPFSSSDKAGTPVSVTISGNAKI